MLARKVYNNGDIKVFSVCQRLPSPRVIMGCRLAAITADRTAQTLIHGKECFILLMKVNPKITLRFREFKLEQII